MRFSTGLQVLAWLCFAEVRAAPLDIKGVLSSAKWSLGTTLSFPMSEQFDNVTERWTIFDPPTYVAAVSPATEADVARAVSFRIAFCSMSAPPDGSDM
jgi:hypothetical protein